MSLLDPETRDELKQLRDMMNENPPATFAEAQAQLVEIKKAIRLLFFIVFKGRF